MVGSEVPELDEVLRGRLRRRFGVAVDSWLDELPSVLAGLAGRWGLAWCSLVQRGSVSVVVRCRTADDAPVVVKVSPDRQRINDEGAALAGWRTGTVPKVLAVDRRVGALLLEGIEPGTPLDQTFAYPGAQQLGNLVTALHEHGPGSDFPSVTARIASLFEAGRSNYARGVGLDEVVPVDLYERSRRLAMRLAADRRHMVTLHGDLTPSNILDGGPVRGLVALDPAPCRGDPAFDLVDLILWRAGDTTTVIERAEQLGPHVDTTAARILDWCAAFAPMTALELAEASPGQAADVSWLLDLTPTPGLA